MESNVKKIEINQLRVGMFIEDVFNEDGVLILSTQAPITSADQIVKFKRQGVQSLYINTEKGRDIEDWNKEGSTGISDDDKRESEYYNELERAKGIHTEVMEVAKQALISIKKGRSFATGDIRKSAIGIVGSVLRNDDALVSLCQIKGYDEYTYEHSVNVGVLVASLTRSMGYDEEKIIEAAMGGLLHDIGKMKVPEYILNKPGKYTDLEFKVMKKHPEHGIAIIEGKPGISDMVRMIIGQHHERFDGSGYPLGLVGKDISEAGLIAAVADVYDALTSNRVYRAAWTPQKALALIFQGADVEYSRTIVERFTRHLGIFPVGSFVKLKNGEMGVVSRMNKGNLLAPLFVALFDANGGRLETPVEYDLALKQKRPGGDDYKIEISLNPKAYRVDIGVYVKDKLF